MKEKILKTIFDLIVFSFENDDSITYDLTFYYEHKDEINKICKEHDILPLLSLGLHKCKDFSLDKEMMVAVYRYEKINYDLLTLCEGLEESKMDFIPLKGSVIRKHYPEPWMRTSCDIDILIHGDDLDRAINYLVDKQGYKFDKKYSHDVSMFSSSGTHVELHYQLIEDNRINDVDEVLNQIWNMVDLKEGYRHYYEMSDELFYFYHIAHMAKHFTSGGCGIRSFVDLWLLEHIDEFDISKRNQLLEKGGLLDFANRARALCEVWFDGKESNDVLNKMESFIISGGVYGCMENRVLVQQQKKGGRIKYALSRIFIGYDGMKILYPIVEKNKFLLPILQIKRWKDLIFDNRLKKSVKELKNNYSISADEAITMQKFLNDIGL